MKLLIYTFVLLIYSASFSAADVEVNLHDEYTFFTISGDIEKGDFDNFRMLVEATKDNSNYHFLALSSPGGNVVEAMKIGELVYNKKMTTIVPEKQDCASACALIWLAGRQKLATVQSRIGFHQSYFIGSNGKSEVSVSANALVGFYLAKINASPKIVEYVTSATPENMEWLTFSEAKALGINVQKVAISEDATTMGSNEAAPILRNKSINKSKKAPNKIQLPSKLNIERAVNNTLKRYKKSGIIGLHSSSTACWERYSELRSARSFQYCYVLDAVSSYLDHIITQKLKSSSYRYFRVKNCAARMNEFFPAIIDQQNIPDLFYKTWLKIALSKVNNFSKRSAD